MNKNFIKRLIVIIYIILTVINFLMIKMWATEFINNIDTIFFKILIIIACLLVSMIYNVFRFSFIIGVWLSVKLAKRKVFKEKLNKDDFEKNIDYFRNVLKDYSPLELSYIDDFKLDFPKDIIAILLSLKNKNIIKLNEKENKIDIVSSANKLTESEMFILERIVFGKVNIEENDMDALLMIIEKEALQKGLLEQDTNLINIGILKYIGLFLAIMFVGLIIGNIFITNIIGEIIMFILTGVLLLLPYLVIFGIVYFFSYAHYKTMNNKKRTPMGEEVNKKLEGLKNYLKDFSNIDKKDSSEIVIWKDYLIYSVLFNQNKDVIIDVYKKYFINDNEKNNLF